MIDGEFDQYENAQQYETQDKIDPNAIFTSLTKLHLFEDNMFLRSQAYNLGIVDNFITELEYKVLHELHETKKTPPLTYFLSAQSQMWIFAAYELLRTWKQQAKQMQNWADNGGLSQKLEALKAKNDSYMHYGRENLILQIENIQKNNNLILLIKKQLAHLHIPFNHLEYLRVAIAKHEISGKSKSIARTPGFASINSLCGSLDYDFENEYYSIGKGYISRRDIADSIRSLDFSETPQTKDELDSYDEYMNGKG